VDLVAARAGGRALAVDGHQLAADRREEQGHQQEDQSEGDQRPVAAHDPRSRRRRRWLHCAPPEGARRSRNQSAPATAPTPATARKPINTAQPPVWPGNERAPASRPPVVCPRRAIRDGGVPGTPGVPAVNRPLPKEPPGPPAVGGWRLEPNTLAPPPGSAKGLSKWVPSVVAAAPPKPRSKAPEPVMGPTLTSATVTMV